MEFFMHILPIQAPGACATGVITPAGADDDGGSCVNAPRTRRMAEDMAKSRATEVRGAKVGLQKDPVTGMVIKTGGASR